MNLITLKKIGGLWYAENLLHWAWADTIDTAIDLLKRR